MGGKDQAAKKQQKAMDQMMDMAIEMRMNAKQLDKQSAKVEQ